ncbi:hypothetical protein ACIRQQ_46735 [Streptomyces fuscichromogenes]|uniref:hypothetical protein n=1 Tax=Streptomyces fuscichromogenes TaxID=1324013 RepID=UPI0038104331
MRQASETTTRITSLNVKWTLVVHDEGLALPAPFGLLPAGVGLEVERAARTS